MAASGMTLECAENETPKDQNYATAGPNSRWQSSQGQIVRK
jgi:hypothetical protein